MSPKPICVLKGSLGAARKAWIVRCVEEARESVTGGRAVDVALDVDPLHLL